MAKKKRIETVQSSEDYMSEQIQAALQGQPSSQTQENAEFSLDSELPAGGVDIIIQDSQGTKRTRGKTLLSDVWDLKDGTRVVVQSNHLHQPIKNEAGLLGQFVGTLVRKGQLCSLSYKDWRDLKKSKLEDILYIIKSKFLYKSECEYWILKAMNNSWSQHKSNLKARYFDDNKSIDVLCKNVPAGVVPDQWISLVQYWKSNDAKKTSERNKRARAMQKTTHTSGTKSFARVAHDMKMKDPEKKEPNRSELYFVTHKRPDGSYLDEDAAIKLQKYMDEHPEAARNLEGKIAWEGDAYSQVLGKDKNGRVKGFGLLPSPKSLLEPPRRLRGIQTSTLDEMTLCQQYQQLVEEMANMRIQLGQLESEVHQLKSKICSAEASSSQPPQGITDGFMSLLNSIGSNLDGMEY